MLKLEESKEIFMYLNTLKFNDTVKLSVEKKYHDLLIYFWTCFFFYRSMLYFLLSFFHRRFTYHNTPMFV